MNLFVHSFFSRIQTNARSNGEKLLSWFRNLIKPLKEREWFKLRQAIMNYLDILIF